MPPDDLDFWKDAPANLSEADKDRFVRIAMEFREDFWFILGIVVGIVLGMGFVIFFVR
jgi:hypothetical protein